MSKAENVESDQPAEFDLKHRVTGAAVLLFLGALVFPWLLGAPSEASKVNASKADENVVSVEPAYIISPNIESEAEPTTIEDSIEETVYISKITPLDAKRNSDLIRAANKAAESSSDNITERKKVNASIPKSSESNNKTPTNSDGVNREKKLGSSEAQKQAQREKELQAALLAEIVSQEGEASTPTSTPAIPNKTKKVDIGWVVQVGLFTEKSRSIALISELKRNGFNASSSIVDTNQGKQTGYRVWLGPFTKRASAMSEKKRLKSKAGKDGFIRVYP